MSKFGIQPARSVLRAQRYTTRQAADAIRVDFIHLANAVNGKVRPCQAVRDRLPELLSAPIEDLFTQDLLQYPYSGDIGVGRPRTSAVSQ